MPSTRSSGTGRPTVANPYRTPVSASGIATLVACEFAKLKRKKLVLAVLALALLFPLPLTAVMSRDQQVFLQLFSANVYFSELLFHPAVLGVVAVMLFFQEEDNGTMKNLLAVPISRSRLLAAKLICIFILSMAYSLMNLAGSLVGGLIVNVYSDVPLACALAFGVGVLVFLATLPVIVVLVAMNRGYVFTIIAIVLHALIGWMIWYVNIRGVPMPLALLPVPLVGTWFLGVVQHASFLGYLGELLALPFSPVVAAVLLVAEGAICCAAAVWLYGRARE